MIAVLFLKNFSSVKGSFIQVGELQVITENIVTDFYNNFVKVSYVGSVSKDNIK
ncbi:MAG: hypothetical protein ACLU6S_12425 [Clostridium sp.]|uniref:hypothetical protein n=1 Tax=Clostridium sp. TaxID=1506 RepID=UPI00399B32D1